MHSKRGGGCIILSSYMFGRAPVNRINFKARVSFQMTAEFRQTANTLHEISVFTAEADFAVNLITTQRSVMRLRRGSRSCFAAAVKIRGAFMTSTSTDYINVTLIENKGSCLMPGHKLFCWVLFIYFCILFIYTTGTIHINMNVVSEANLSTLFHLMTPQQQQQQQQFTKLTGEEA